MEFCPLPLSFAILTADAGVQLFAQPDRLDGPALAWLGQGVTVRPPAELGPALDALGAAKARVRLDCSSAAAWIADRLGRAGAVVDNGADPCLLAKAGETAVELARGLHERGGGGGLAPSAPPGRRGHGPLPGLAGGRGTGGQGG